MDMLARRHASPLAWDGDPNRHCASSALMALASPGVSLEVVIAVVVVVAVAVAVVWVSCCAAKASISNKASDADGRNVDDTMRSSDDANIRREQNDGMPSKVPL